MASGTISREMGGYEKLLGILLWEPGSGECGAGFTVREGPDMQVTGEHVVTQAQSHYYLSFGCTRKYS